MRNRLKILSVLLMIVVFSIPSYASRFEHGPTKTDLFMMFYGFSQHNWTMVDGNVQSLEQGNIHLSEDYSHDERASVLVDGLIFGAVELKLNAVYDTRLRYYPGNRDQRDFRFRLGMNMAESYQKEHELGEGFAVETRADFGGQTDWRIQDTDKRLLTEPFADLKLELFAKISYNQHWLALGDQQVTLDGTQFTLQNRNLLAAQLHLEKAPLQFTGLAAQVKGYTFSEGGAADTTGIRADGGSGPYYLSYAPLTRGSELIRIEVRDRYNSEIIVSSHVQRRGEDYTIDYERGLVIFEHPIPAEDIHGNPQYIVIQYDYEYNSQGDYNRYLTGGQFKLGLGRDPQASYVAVNYVKEFDDADSWEWSDGLRDAIQATADSTGVPIDTLWSQQPPPPTTDHEVKSVNSQLTFGETVMNAELAQSQFGDVDDDDEDKAFRTEIKSHLRPGIRFEGNYWRVDRQYQAIGDPNLDIDKEKWRLFADYEYQDQQFLTAEYRHDRNIDYDDSTNVKNDKIVRFGWREEIPNIPHIKVQVEQRTNFDRFDTIDTQRNTIRSEIKHHMLDRKLSASAGHEYERLDDELNPANDTGRHSGRIGLKWQLRANLLTEINHRTEFTQNRETDIYTGREDISRLGLKWTPLAPLETSANYEYRRFGGDFADLGLSNDANRTDKTLSLSAKFAPSERVTNTFKYELRRAEDFQSEERNETNKNLFRDQLIFYLTPDLHFNFVGELEDLDEWKNSAHGQTLLKRLLGEANYHIFARLDAFLGYEWREWEDDRFAASKSRTQRGLVGVRYYFIDAVYGRIWLRHAQTELIGDMATEPMVQQRAGLEVGTDIKTHFRGAVGYERITYENKENPADDYDANRVYGKLMVKF